MAGIDIAALVSGIAGQSTNSLDAINSAIAAVSGSATLQDESFAKSQELGKGIADAGYLTTLTKGLADASAQKGTADFARLLLGDTEDVTGTMAALANDFNSSEDKRKEMLKGIQAKQAISPFEDPVGWLVSKMTVDSDIQAYNLAGQESQDAFERIQKINQAIDARAQANRNQEQTTTTASAQAAAAAVRNAAMEHVEELSRQALITNANSYEKIAGLNLQQLQVKTQAFHAEVEYKNLQNQQAQLRLAQDRAKIEQQEFAWRKAEVGEREALEGRITAAVNTGFSKAGIKYEMTQARIQDLKAMLSGKVPWDPKLKAAYELGMNNMLAGTESGEKIYSADPSDALTLIRALNAPLSADAVVTAKLIEAAQLNVAAPNNMAWQKAVAEKNIPLQKKLIRDAVQASVQGQFDNASAPTSVAYLPDAVEIANRIPSLRESDLYKRVIEPNAKAGVDLSDPRTVVQLASRVYGNDIEAIARDVASFYKAGQLANVESHQLPQFGIAPHVSYKMRGFKGIVDYTNPLQIKRDNMQGSILGSEAFGKANYGLR